MSCAILGTVTMVSAERFLTVSQVATELHLSIETVRRYLRAGTLHGFQINRQAGWLVSREDLDRFITESDTRHPE